MKQCSNCKYFDSLYIQNKLNECILKAYNITSFGLCKDRKAVKYNHICIDYEKRYNDG